MKKPPPYSVLISIVLVGFFGALLTGCNKTSYGTDECSANQGMPIANYKPGGGKTDVTFIAFGDSQLWEPTLRQNDIQVEALNHFTKALTWGDAGYPELGTIDDVRGIIMAGDITQNGRDGRGFGNDEYGDFTSRYGLCGNKLVKYHMYEGYGNHDFYEWNNIAYLPGDHPVADSVAVRNAYRAGLNKTAPGMDGHYSWDWDNIRFVQLNLAPSDLDPRLAKKGLRDPRNALNFFREDLEENVKGTKKKVILVSHYGPSPTFEWTQPQIDSLCSVITEYSNNMMAYLHGHSHSTNQYNWCNIPVFNVGSPYYLNYNSDSRGRFTVFRIKENDDRSLRLVAADVSWNPKTYTPGKSETLDLEMKRWRRYPYDSTVLPAP